MLVGALPYFIPLVLYTFKLWMDKNFGGSATMEMIAVLIMFGPTGLQSGPIEYVISGVVIMFLLPLSLSLVFSIAELSLVAVLKKKYPTAKNIKKINRAHAITKLLLIVSLFAIIIAFLWHVFFVNQFITMHVKGHANQPDYFQQYYVDPKTVAITAPKKKKNLLLLYVESLEDSFKDPAFYGRNLLATMTPIEQKSYLFNLRTTGTAFETVPGHVNSQCGLPLKSAFFIDINNEQKQPTLLQNAICLSDILAKNGYYNVFMVSSTTFTGGLGYFYDHHHFNETKYLEYWQAHGYADNSPDKQGPWGLYDGDILKEGYKELESLQAKRQKTGQPFFLNISTIDIHVPASSPCTYKKDPQPFDEVVECTSAAIADFITRADKNGLLKDTELYLMGDHRIVAVSGVEMKKWNKAYPHREPYSLLYSKDITPKRRDITHYDVFPTLLEVLGFAIDGHRLGFGYSAMADFPNYPSIEQWNNIMHLSTMPSEKYFSLWAWRDAAFKRYMAPKP